MKDQFYSMRVLVFSLCLGYFGACSATKPHLTESRALRPTSDEVVTFYALGDWGTGDTKQRAVAIALRDEIRGLERNEVRRELPPFAVELGDNFYPKGLPHTAWNAPEVTAILERVFGQVYYDVKYRGQVIDFHIIPGNHDYNNLIFNGLSWGDVIHQETTAESLYANYNYYPMQHNGIPDSNDRAEFEKLEREPIELMTLPQKIPLPESDQRAVAFFALDTQAILDLYRTKKRVQVQKHWQTLETLLRNDNGTWKIILGHHPIVSYGYHGGYRPAEQWVWSGTRGFIPPYLRPIPYLSAALLGTFVHPGFYSLGAFSLSSTLTDLHLRKALSPSIQDMGTSAFMQFKRKMLEVMQAHGVKLYLAGHDHNLQLIDLSREFKQEFQAYQIVSGSAGKVSPVRNSKGSLILGSGALGFIRFDATEEEIWFEFFKVDQERSRSDSVGKFRLTKSGLQKAPERFR